MLAAVLIRRFLEMKNKDSKKDIWLNLSSEYKALIKTNMLKAIITERDRSVKFNFCDTVATIAQNIFDLDDEGENGEEFNDLISYFMGILSNPSINENDTLEVEAAVVIVSKVFGFVYTYIKSNLDVIVNAFKVYFTINNMNLRTKCVEALTEIISIVSKKEAKRFKDLVFNILETTLKCSEDPKEEANVFLFLI